MCIQGCEFCVAFEHVTAWRTFIIIIIIIIIIAPCASGRVRLSHCLPNPPSRMPLPWPHSSSSTLLCLSLSTVLLQVVFGLPLALPPSGVHLNAAKQSFTPSLLSTFPNQTHLLLCTWQLISAVSAISTTLLFVILCCHLILSIGPRHILVLLPIPLAAHTFHSLQNAPCTFCSLFLISLLPPSLEIGLFNLNSLLQVQLRMTQQNKQREIQKKLGQQQVQL